MIFGRIHGVVARAVDDDVGRDTLHARGHVHRIGDIEGGMVEGGDLVARRELVNHGRAELARRADHGDPHHHAAL
jgi:hypothetical protein